MGCQYTPVLSIATWVTPWLLSQPASSSSSSVIVPNVRNCLVGWPSGPLSTAHAATTFLWMSSPQHRSITMSIHVPQAESNEPERSSQPVKSLTCVLLVTESDNP